MIEIEIPKDIHEYEPKLIGPFTTRQIVCGVPGIALCVLAFWGTTQLFGEDSSIRIFAAMLVAIPFALVGWYKPYGMHFEKFVKSVFFTSVLSPKHRKYMTNNIYEQFDISIDNEEKALQNEKGTQKSKFNSKTNPKHQTPKKTKPDKSTKRKEKKQ